MPPARSILGHLSRLLAELPLSFGLAGDMIRRCPSCDLKMFLTRPSAVFLKGAEDGRLLTEIYYVTQDTKQICGKLFENNILNIFRLTQAIKFAAFISDDSSCQVSEISEEDFARGTGSSSSHGSTMRIPREKGLFDNPAFGIFQCNAKIFQSANVLS